MERILNADALQFFSCSCVLSSFRCAFFAFYVNFDYRLDFQMSQWWLWIFLFYTFLSVRLIHMPCRSAVNRFRKSKQKDVFVCDWKINLHSNIEWRIQFGSVESTPEAKKNFIWINMNGLVFVMLDYSSENTTFL